MDLLQEFYETTLEALKDAKNDRLWFKTNTKVKHTTYPSLLLFVTPSADSINCEILVLQLFLGLFFFSSLQLGKLYLEREEYGKLQKILRQLHQSCQVRLYSKSLQLSKQRCCL